MLSVKVWTRPCSDFQIAHALAFRPVRVWSCFRWSLLRVGAVCTPVKLVRGAWNWRTPSLGLLREESSLRATVSPAGVSLSWTVCLMHFHKVSDDRAVWKSTQSSPGSSRHLTVTWLKTAVVLESYFMDCLSSWNSEDAALAGCRRVSQLAC